MADKSAYGKFLEDNTKGSLNKVFLGLSAVEIAQSDNKLKALIKTLFQLILFKPLLAIGLAGAFSSMGKSIRALVKDTGSLQAALAKLQQIQGLQRLFAPLVGGLDAAKLKVAEFVNFAARNNLKLGDVGQAGHDLQVLTHGAYAGASALEDIGNSAAATGNGIAETASAVGGFYADLRDGLPIARAAEQLRQMGILSDADVTKLTALQQSGAGTRQVFSALTSVLGGNAGAMRGLRDDVQSVTSAYEAAKTNLQEKFASPFVASDIQNTKNMTDAMNAIAPSVSRVAPFLEKLTNGFSTLNSWMAKTAAESPILSAMAENLVTVLSSLVGVVSVVAGIALGAWLLEAAAGMLTFTSAIGAATIAVRLFGAAVALTGIGAILLVIGTAAGVLMNFVSSSDAATKALEQQKRAHDQTNAAMRKQIDSAKTLREHHEALAKAISNSSDAQEEYKRALEEQAAADSSTLNSVKAKIGGFFGKDWGHDAAAAAKVAEAERNVENAQRIRNEQQARVSKMDKTIISPERAQANIEVARARAITAGDQGHAVALDNLGNFAQNFERLRGIYGDQGAQSKALALTNAQIAEQASAPVADHLAKLGLGGEFGGGQDVQKQIRDLQKDALRYLQSIDAKTGAPTPPPNSPSSDNDY